MTNDHDLAEDTLARGGYAVLSPSMNSLFESIEIRLSIRAAVRCSEYQAVLYAIYSGPYADYHTAKVFA
jgi:hypothetical protein